MWLTEVSVDADIDDMTSDTDSSTAINMADNIPSLTDIVDYLF